VCRRQGLDTMSTTTATSSSETNPDDRHALVPRVGRRPTDELDMLYFLSLKLITLNARMTTTSEARLSTLGGLRQARNLTSVATADGTHHRHPGCTPWAERCMLASSN